MNLSDELDAELEAMATNATLQNNSAASSISDTQIAQWQTLFSYSAEEANAAIEAYRSDTSIRRITAQQWETVRERMEEKGHDRESYDHYLRITGLMQSGQKSVTLQTRDKKAHKTNYLVLLNGVISTVSKVRQYTQLTRQIKVLLGTNQAGEDVQLVELRGHELDILKRNVPHSAQNIVAYPQNIADKYLEDLSRAPALGIDTTLPQHRLDRADELARPAQDEYPVWYFFYGTLADPSKLVSLLALPAAPVLEPATVKGGKLKMWGQYRALIDGRPEDTVQGLAYKVKSLAFERTLRGYETAKYEVVRCKIRVDGGGEVWGLTFRFCGGEELLR